MLFYVITSDRELSLLQLFSITMLLLVLRAYGTPGARCLGIFGHSLQCPDQWCTVYMKTQSLFQLHDR